jgi:clathrin heavy chain
LKIFSIEHKKKLKNYQIPDQVVFWKWISNNTLALVTATSVFHWTKEGGGDPVKVFDRYVFLYHFIAFLACLLLFLTITYLFYPRNPDLATAQIINYRTDSTQQWLCLIGISQKEGRITGNMQLYSVEKNVSQAIEGHAAAFANYTVPGATRPSTLFAFAVRTAAAAKV